MGHTVTLYSFRGEMFSVLCFVDFCLCFFFRQGEVAKAEGGYEGMERSVGLGCMVWNCQRINKSLK